MSRRRPPWDNPTSRVALIALAVVLVAFLLVRAHEHGRPAGGLDVPPGRFDPQERALPASPCEHGTPDEKGQAALARIAYPWRDLGFEVVFRPGRRGYLGTTFVADRRIEVYVRTCQTVASVANVTGHELGHAVDVTYNTEARRDAWARARGFDPAAPWFGCSGCTDYETGAGDFAESFAWLKAPRAEFMSRMAPAPTDDQAPRLEPFFHPDPPPTTAAPSTTRRGLCIGTGCS